MNLREFFSIIFPKTLYSQIPVCYTLPRIYQIRGAFCPLDWFVNFPV